MVWFDKFFSSSQKLVKSQRSIESKNGNVVIWRVFFRSSSSLQTSWFPYAGINTIVKQKLDSITVDDGPLHKQVKPDKQTNKQIKQNNKPYSWPFCFVYRTEASFDDRRWFYAGSKCVLIIKISAIRDTCECCSSLHNRTVGGSENMGGSKVGD